MPHQPSATNGKICYLEIPSTDITRSKTFYESVFGWDTRLRGDGHIAFDDAVGGVSGTWVKGRKSFTEVSLLVYIMVDSVSDTLDKIIAHDGKVVQAIGMDAPQVTARFSDPDGNILGLYQEPG